MRRRAFHRTLAAIPVSVALGATAQSKRPLRVAWVSAERKDRPSQNYAAFRTGMRELGYAEGRDLYINTWWGGGSRDQLESLVPEMLRAQPDVLLASGGLALGALIRSGVKLPIVFSVSADPVAAGFVQTFARPGANMTGVSLFTLALVGKRLEILKDILPGARTVALIANPQHPGESQEFDAAKGAAARLGLEVRYFPVKGESELDAAFADIARQRDDAIVAFADGCTMTFASQIAASGADGRCGKLRYCRCSGLCERSVGLRDGGLRQLDSFVRGLDFTCDRCGGVGERRALRLEYSRALLYLGELARCAFSVDLQTTQLVATLSRQPLGGLHGCAYFGDAATGMLFRGRAPCELLCCFTYLVLEISALGDGALAVGLYPLA